MKLFKILTAVLVVAAAPAFAAGTVTTTTKREQTYTNYTINSIVSKMYVAGQIGYGMPTESSLEDNAVYAGAVGYKLTPAVRVELEGSYRNNDSDAVGIYGDSRNTLWMANAWYDFVNSTKFTPYIGGGAGVAFNRTTITGPVYFKDHDAAFTYQAGAGVAYKLCEHMDLTADYRFIDTSNFDLGDDYKTHEVRAGIRYNF